MKNENGRLCFQARRERDSDAGELSWDPQKTAAIICDMWDQHWCRGAASRVAEMAPRMNRMIGELRNQGVFIIHAPSDTMPFYENHPGRKLATNVPRMESPVLLRSWMPFHAGREGAWPIDDSDGGCDCDPKCPSARKWSRQIDTIEIKDGDAITDNEEAFHLMKHRNIENVLIMGVHTNMCVLGRPFGIRQLVTQGLNVVLIRDMTDSMYNSKMHPFVDHFTGTDLIISHIERYWCPTVASDQILGGQPFRFQEDTRPTGL